MNSAKMWHPDTPPSVLGRRARRCPWDALRYAADRLTPKTLAYCARQCSGTGDALKFASHLLPPPLLAECAMEDPYWALRYAVNHMSPELISETWRRLYDTDIDMFRRLIREFIAEMNEMMIRAARNMLAERKPLPRKRTRRRSE